MDTQETQEREIGWDDVIEHDSQFIEISEGDYDFFVQSFQRERFNGSEKMPPCNIAILKLIINYNGQQVPLEYRLFLHSRSEWKLSEFFASIGQKKKGEKLRMNWNKVPGSRGRCKIGFRMYEGNKYNDIKKFYPSAGYDQLSQQPSYSGYQNQQMPTSAGKGKNSGYTPGSF